MSEDEAVAALYEYKYESSLGKYVFEAFRDRICGNEHNSKVVRDAIAHAKTVGVTLTEPTVAGLSVGAASVVAVAVASVLPAMLVAVGAPVIGGITLLLIQTGVEGFCRWTRAVIESADKEEQTNEGE